MNTATLDRPAVLDDAAYTALWESQYAAIVRYMRGRAPSAVAEDLAAETFTKAWAGRATYRPSAGTVEGWLYGIAGNVVVDYYRATGRRPHTADLAGVDVAYDYDLGAEVADQLDALADADRARLVVAIALADLPDRQRQVLELRYLQAQPVTAVAEVLACPEGTVKSITHRALAALRALLAPQPEPESAPEPAALVAAPAPVPEPRSAPHAVTPVHPRRRLGRVGRRRPGRPGVLAVAAPPPCRPPRHPTRPGNTASRPRRGGPILRCGSTPATAEAGRHRLAVRRRSTPPLPGRPRPARQRREELTPMWLAPTTPWEWLILTLIVGAAATVLHIVYRMWQSARRQQSELTVHWVRLEDFFAKYRRPATGRVPVAEVVGHDMPLGDNDNTVAFWAAEYRARHRLEVGDPQ